MTRKSIVPYSGTSERVITRSSEFELVEADNGVDVDVSDTKAVDHALIDSNPTDQRFITTHQ